MDGKRKRNDYEQASLVPLSPNVPVKQAKRRLGGDFKACLEFESKQAAVKASVDVIDLTSSPSRPDSTFEFKQQHRGPRSGKPNSLNNIHAASHTQSTTYSIQSHSHQQPPHSTGLPQLAFSTQTPPPPYSSSPHYKQFLPTGTDSRYFNQNQAPRLLSIFKDNSSGFEGPKQAQGTSSNSPRASIQPSSLDTVKKEKPTKAKPKKPRAKKPKTEPELCQEQQDLVDLILSGQNVFYTGSAGCGKSTVLKAFVKQLRDKGKKVVIIAPTGRAALEVNGQTFFTFAGWVPDSFKKPIKKLRSAAHGTFVRKRMNDVHVLVIDEISMMENYALERLNQVMQEARGNSKAFGGVQVVVTGDFCQLPPVKPFRTCIDCGRELMERMGGSSFKCPQHGEVLEIDKWAFRSSAWKQAEFQHVNLTTIHRQRDRTFIDILEKLRMGKQLATEDTALLLNHKCNVNNAVKLYSTREEVRRINMAEFDKLPSGKRTFKCHDHFQQNPAHRHLDRKGERGHDGSFVSLREHKFDPQVELKEGMLVILLVNLNIEEGLVNGSQGVIVGWEPYDPAKMPKAVNRGDSSGNSKVPISANTLTGEYAALREANISTFIRQAAKREWPIVKFDNGLTKTIFADCIINELGDERPYSLLSRTQIPLLAGWAMTVHKSQGMTLNRVVVDLSKSFEEGQMYVALSRARALNGLRVDGLGRNGGGGNEQVMEFLWEKFKVR